MELRNRYLVLGLTAVLVLTTTAFQLDRRLAVTSATGTDGQSAAMSLNVKSPSAACDDPDKPTQCDLAIGSTFTLAVSVASLPLDEAMQDEASYVSFQSQLFYGDLAFKPAATADEEIVWPESALPVRSPADPSGLERTVAHADASAAAPPFPPSTHTGNIVQIVLNCSAEPQSFQLALLPYDPTGRPLGAGFRLVDEQSGELGETAPAALAGEQDLDLDGDPQTPPETVEVAATLQINCGEVPTPAATPTPTASPTPSPTATPTTPAAPAGDVNCNGAVNSIDALFVLQFVAELLSALPCQDAADVNENGTANAVDAALILQFVADIIDSLPP